jgi:hypothetical protein
MMASSETRVYPKLRAVYPVAQKESKVLQMIIKGNLIFLTGPGAIQASILRHRLCHDLRELVTQMALQHTFMSV